jgi:large subunit ribosomal protein L25
MAKKEFPKLTLEKRKITGRKVKVLRREGILPANIYGKDIKSLAVQLNLKSFLPVFKEVGETGLVELKIAGETKTRPILIHNVQVNPLSDQPIHVDFYQVDLKKKVTTEVPIELVSEAPAVTQKIGILIQPLTEVEVEALPTELPDKFEVDISSLKKIDNAVTVADLKIPEGVKILTSQNEILAKIEPPAKEEVVAPPPVEEVPVEEVPAEEAAPTPEGVPPTEEAKPAKEKPTPPTGRPTEEKVEKEKKKE